MLFLSVLPLSIKHTNSKFDFFHRIYRAVQSLTGYIYRSYNFNQFTTSVFPLVLGIISFAVFAIAADSVYYGTLSFTVDGQPFRDVGHVVSTLFDPTTLATVRADGDIVITPLNNLLYNMNVDNLAQHGLHPRYTHFAVNLPLLFGPLAVFGFLYMPNVIAKVQNDDHTHLLYGKFIANND